MIAEGLFLLFKELLFFVGIIGNSGSFPEPLSPQDEKMYLERYYEGDKEARRILIEHNLRLVAHVCKKFNTKNTENDDLISIGTIGLIKAISTYNPKKNVQLATYAARCIENAIVSLWLKILILPQLLFNIIIIKQFKKISICNYVYTYLFKYN